MNLETDYLVIGSGAAGLSFALKVAEKSHVIVVTKGEMNECNTNYAQGGICSVTYEPDTFEKHIHDTMVCGAGICDLDAVEQVVTRAPMLMKDLIRWGTRFDRTPEGKYELAREGGHSEHRILHHKDETGAEIERTLISQVKSHRNIEVREYHFAVDLLTQHHLGRLVTRHMDDIECYGAYVMDLKRERIFTILSKVTVLATGGVGNVYHVKFTRSPANFIRQGKEPYSLNRMFDFDIVRNGDRAWTAGSDGSIAVVRRTMGKNNILFTRRPAEKGGGLFDQLIVSKGNGQFPVKASNPRMAIEKYGALKGGYLALRRVLRCHPFYKGDLNDPVP